MLKFTIDNMISQQDFSFTEDMLDYLFENLSSEVLLKLYKTCKFFYSKFGLNIIENFEICIKKEEERIVGNSLTICRSNPSYSMLKNLWICKSFEFYDDATDKPLEYKKINGRTYNQLQLIGGTFPETDFNFLIQARTLDRIYIDGAIVPASASKHCLAIEDIIERAPQVSTFHLTIDDAFYESFPPMDMAKLLGIDRRTKLTSLQISGLSKVPDPLLVVEFFKKHASPDIDYYFGFNDYDEAYDVKKVKRFYKTIDAKIRDWKVDLYPQSAITSFVDLNGKNAVIIGGSDGIGTETTISFRQFGASVIVVSRNREQLIDMIDECQGFENAGFLHTVYDDAQSEDNFDNLFERVKYRFGKKIDILVINAEIFENGMVPYSKEYFRDNISEAHYKVIKKAMPYLSESKGSIINVSAAFDKPSDAPSIPKLKDSMQNALSSSGIRINSVNLVSALPRPAGMNDDDYKKVLEEKKKFHEEQTAKAIVFLASDSAKLINGLTIPVNPLNLL